MKALTAASVALLSLLAFVLTACSSPDVQQSRQAGLERRQDRMDSRTYARQRRWEERAEREDARARARFDSW